MYPIPTGSVHPLVISHAAASSRTYYLARYLDRTGSGQADIEMKAALGWLGIAKPTFKRDLCQLKARGFIRNYKWDKQAGIVRVWYTSLFVVARALGLDDLGVVIKDIPITQLRRSERRPFATEAIAIRSQEQAAYQVKKKNKLKLKQIVCPSLLVPQLSSSSASSQGALRVKGFGKRYIYLPKTAILAGASQKLIAERLNKSRATVQRHLDNRYRAKRDIDPILKRQQAIEAELSILFEIKEGNGNDLNIEKQHYFISGGKAWLAGTTLYDPRFHVFSNKVSRSRYKRWLKAHPLPVEWVFLDAPFDEALGSDPTEAWLLPYVGGIFVSSPIAPITSIPQIA